MASLGDGFASTVNRLPWGGKVHPDHSGTILLRVPTRQGDLRNDASPSPSTPQVTGPQSGSGHRNRLALISLYSGIASRSLLVIAVLLTVTFRMFPDLPSVPAAVAIIGVDIAWIATGVGAIATAHIARGQIRRRQETGSRQAKIGLILGYSFLLVFVGSAIFWNGIRCPCI